MMENDVYKRLEEVKLLPLYTATDLSYLHILEEILLKHDVPFIEVTFRSNLALEAIKAFCIRQANGWCRNGSYVRRSSKSS